MNSMRYAFQFDSSLDQMIYMCVYIYIHMHIHVHLYKYVHKHTRIYDLDEMSL